MENLFIIFFFFCKVLLYLIETRVQWPERCGLFFSFLYVTIAKLREILFSSHMLPAGISGGIFSLIFSKFN